MFSQGKDADTRTIDYRPDMTRVQAIRLVIAASPRKMMTLAQVRLLFPFHNHRQRHTSCIV